MNTREAIQILRDKGTLRADGLPAHMLPPSDVGSATARAIAELARRTRAHSTERAWTAPTTFLQPLP